MFGATLIDVFAFACFLLCWLGYSIFSSRMWLSGSNVPSVMHEYRVRWMRRMLNRDHRVADVTILTSQVRSASLFVTTNILIIAGLMAAFSGLDIARSMVTDFSFVVRAPKELWEIKMLVLILIFVHAFFTFVWSMRQVNTALVVIGAAPFPDEPDAPDRQGFPERAALLITRSVNTFARGLRAYYFGMAMLSWFIQPWLLAVASVLVVWVLYRREYRSVTLQALLASDSELAKSE